MSTAAAMATVFRGADERRDVMQPLIDLAHRTGWLAFHPYRSNRSAPGFPDLVLVRTPRQDKAHYGAPYIVFVETKRESGRLTLAQRAWGTALGCVELVTEGAVAYRVVRPSTRHELEALLTAPVGRRDPHEGALRLPGFDS